MEQTDARKETMNCVKETEARIEYTRTIENQITTQTKQFVRK